MIKKVFGVDFDSPGGALTLQPYEVSTKLDDGVCTRTHADGWTITGLIVEDHYVWVSEFKAVHPELGVVYGDFESTVYATSEEAFAHFYERHPPTAWDYGDI